MPLTKILIVDCSAPARTALRQALAAEPGLQVAAETDSGTAALRLIREHNPDVVLVSICLHGENGSDLTAKVMEELPRPVVIVTSANPRCLRLAYQALEHGALEVVAKLPAATAASFDAERQRLVWLLHTAAERPVVHRFRLLSSRRRLAVGGTPAPSPASGPATAGGGNGAQPRILLFGASTGGPLLLARVLAALPRPYGSPIVVVQHLATGFGEGFAEWLGAASRFDVQLIDRPHRLEAGKVYVAPDSTPIELPWTGGVAPAASSAGAGSIDRAFGSAAASYGRHALAVLLTGLGRDGSAGCEALRAAGGTTIAQAPWTCVGSGMPLAAIAASGVSHVLTPDEIVSYLQTL